VFAWMDQLLPDERDPAASVEQITRAVGLDVAAHEATGLPIKDISCGVPYILLPVATRANVDAAVPDVKGLQQIRSAFGAEHTGVYLFSTEGASDDVSAYSRMFSSGLGIPEDPATGSACGPLGCYQVRRVRPGPQGAPRAGAPVADAQGAPSRPGARVTRMVSWQGVAMGRPSRIHIAITEDDAGAITRVQVGGEAIVVARGTLTAR
jgi:trans-2,3-dihydro-3-hydroxyanthranilate isomerase